MSNGPALPKAFISYSWSSPGHQDRIRHWAERLIEDGVDVVLDVWELKEGHDKYAFMERAVNDDTVTHVLMFCDSQYATKADGRKAGVGTESQIISKEIYDKVRQSKFIPIVCELDSEAEPYLPTFLKSRIWIDFSSPEAANENWEQLVRVLHGRPTHQKPSLGKPPAYVLAADTIPPSPAAAKFAALKQALLQGKPRVALYRQDFLDACYAYADSLRTRQRPEVPNFGERVVADCGKLKHVRDHFVDWVLLEWGESPSKELNETLLTTLERLLELKLRPPELNQWSESWFDAHRVFVYETFLYVVAALLKSGAFASLHLVLTGHYLSPDPYGGSTGKFETFKAFYGQSESLRVLDTPERKFYSPTAELVKRQADRTDIPFADVMQAELLILLMSFVGGDVYWFPQTLHYSGSQQGFPFFVRAAQHRNFLKLAEVTGIADANELRDAVRKGHERSGVSQWHTFRLYDRSFWTSMSMDALDTLR